MKLSFVFARKVAAGFLAVAVAAAGANAFAANVTWKASNQGGAARAWNTASNWSPSGVPANGDSVYFGPLGSGPQFQVNLGSDTNELASVNFTSAATGGYRIANNALVVNGNIVNNSTNLSTAGTGEASVVLPTLRLAGDTLLSGNGKPTEVFNGIEGVGHTLTVTTNNLILFGVPSEANIVASAGTFSLGDIVGLADLTVGAVGVVGGIPNRDPGQFFSTNGAGTLTFQNTSTVNMGVAGTSPSAGFPGTNYDQFQTTGAVNFGGTLNIDWSQVGSSLFTNYTTFDLFDGGSYAGNFSAVSLAGASAPYAGLSFTQNGGEWRTQEFVGQGGQNQWLVFQSQSGNLVVVPEPSTIVFAGLGVAMSGWTMWKKRRLSKILAAKAA